MRTARPALALAAAVLLTLWSSPGIADESADRHAAAVDVLSELHSVDMVEALLPSIMAQVRQNLTRGDPDLTKEFDALTPSLRAKAEATEPVLMGKLADVYANLFTVDELKDMLAYYRSPVGQRIIASQSTINQNMLSAAREWGTSVAQLMARDASTALQGTAPIPPPAPEPPTPAAPPTPTAPAN